MHRPGARPKCCQGQALSEAALCAQVAASPSSSLAWVQFMAHHLAQGEVGAARQTAERALRTIHFRCSSCIRWGVLSTGWRSRVGAPVASDIPASTLRTPRQELLSPDPSHAAAAADAMHDGRTDSCHQHMPQSPRRSWMPADPRCAAHPPCSMASS